MQKLSVDQAYLRAISTTNEDSWVYSLSEECYKCPYSKLLSISPHKRIHTKIGVARSVFFKVFDQDMGDYAFENQTAICEIAPNLGEFGVYNLTVTDNKTCTFTTDKEPVDIYLPMLLVAIIFASITIILQATRYLYKRCSRLAETGNSGDEIVDMNKKVPVKKRMKSIDTFRGIIIVLMIFVNNGGGEYWWIDHAPWNGLHVADLVFPSFIWIMGVCIPLSIKSQLGRNISKKSILLNILWRSVKLFLIGLFLNSINGAKFEDLRIMGILQRLGIAYFLVASLYTIFVTNEYILPQGRVKRALFDIIYIKYVWIFGIAITAVNMAIIYALDVPGCPRGYLGPGGLHEMGSYKNCMGGAAGYIDKLILGTNHIYQHPTAKKIYNSTAFDPEGLLGCLLTTVQTILGLQCGTTILIYTTWKSRVNRWLSWSVGCGVIAGVLCLFSKEEGWIPVNKNLMSLSFVLATSSMAFFFEALCFLLIDVKGKWNGYPFLQCGMNAILLYVGHSVLHKMLPWHWSTGLMNTHFMLLLKCTWTTFLWIIVAIYCYKKNFFYVL